MTAPRYPSLFQINTRVWLQHLSRRAGRRVTLADIEDKTIDELKRQLADQRKAVLTLENTNSPSTKTADATRPGTPDIARTASGELAAAQAKLAGLQKALDAAGSTDKELRVFTVAEGGSEHVAADDPDPARQLITDWFADRLGTIPATAQSAA